MIRKAMMIASSVARIGSRIFASTCSPTAPIASEVSVTPSCIAAMKRGGSPVIRSTCRAVRWPSSASSCIRVRRTVTRPYSAATKNAFRSSRAASARSSKKIVTPGSPGRGYSRRRRPRLRLSIGQGSAVTGARGAALVDEPLEVRERLGDGKAPRGRAQLAPEELERDLIAAARRAAERGLGLVEPAPVVLDQGLGAGDRIGDRLAVAGVGDPRRELADAAERAEVVAERVGPAVGPPADGRRDRIEQEVGADEHAVAEQRDVAVGVPGHLEHAPAVDLVALVQQVRVAYEADERPVERALL